MLFYRTIMQNKNLEMITENSISSQKKRDLVVFEQKLSTFPLKNITDGAGTLISCKNFPDEFCTNCRQTTIAFNRGKNVLAILNEKREYY